jgi:cytochrome P450
VVLKLTKSLLKSESTEHEQSQAGYAPYSALVRHMIGIRWLSDLIGGEVAQQQQKMVSFAREAIELRFKEEEDGQKDTQTEQSQRDIVHYLLHAKDPRTGKFFTRGELESESELLLLAGGDTTACVLSGCIFYLLHNPHTLYRLTKEIRTQFNTIEDIRPSHHALSSLPYLRACIDETMRMSPPALGPLLRKVRPGGATIDGKVYPAGVEVAVTTYALHRREENFPDGFCFRPERWIVDTETGVSEGDVAAAQAAFAPFSLGTRGCVGKNMAYMELTTAVARLLWQFDVKAVQTKPVGEDNRAQVWGRRRKREYQMADFFIAERDGPFVAFRDRTLNENIASDPVAL